MKVKVQFKLWNLEDFGDHANASRILSDLQRQPEELRPSSFGVWEATQKLNAHSAEEVLGEWLNRRGNPNMGQVVLQSGGSSGTEWMVSWQRDSKQPRFHTITAWTDPQYVRSAEGQRRLLGLVDTLCISTRAVFARILTTVPEKTDAYSMVNLRVRLPEPCWVQYFGAPYIELFGRDQLLSTPCHDVREIGAEHIRIALGDSPLDGIEREAAEAVRKHLGVDAFVERGRAVRIYKTGVHPEFDFSKVSNEVTIN